jgi:alpha-D-xyloside xylohydrolase
MMRPMALAFPGDPACTHLERQYMLGGDLLVAPVLSAAGEVSYYVPAGRWTDLLRGTVVDGPRWIQERHGFDTLPVLVRPGAVIAMGARDDRPDYDYLDGVTLRVHELGEAAQVTVPVPSKTGDVSASFTVTRDGSEIRVERHGAQAHWHIDLVRHHAISASAGVVTSTPDGARLDVTVEIDAVTIVVDDEHK